MPSTIIQIYNHTLPSKCLHTKIHATVDPCFMCRLNSVCISVLQSQLLLWLLRQCGFTLTYVFFRVKLRSKFTISEFESGKLLWSLPPFDNVNCLISKITNSSFVAVVLFVFHFPLVRPRSTRCFLKYFFLSSQLANSKVANFFDLYRLLIMWIAWYLK